MPAAALEDEAVTAAEEYSADQTFRFDNAEEFKRTLLTRKGRKTLYKYELAPELYDHSFNEVYYWGTGKRAINSNSFLKKDEVRLCYDRNVNFYYHIGKRNSKALYALAGNVYTKAVEIGGRKIYQIDCGGRISYIWMQKDVCFELIVSEDVPNARNYFRHADAITRRNGKLYGSGVDMQAKMRMLDGGFPPLENPECWAQMKRNAMAGELADRVLPVTITASARQPVRIETGINYDELSSVYFLRQDVHAFVTGLEYVFISPELPGASLYKCVLGASIEAGLIGPELYLADGTPSGEYLSGTFYVPAEYVQPSGKAKPHESDW